MNIYTNGNDTLDSFASFWRTVAATFSNRSSVLGYELINEPPFPDLVDVVKIGEVDRLTAYFWFRWGDVSIFILRSTQALAIADEEKQFLSST